MSGTIHADNTVYTAHFVRPNFSFAETSYILEMLSEMLFSVVNN
ncbi:MAG: hypothetical protein WBA71_05335 [Candidatus Humimicrobiia bacterium]